MNPMMMMAAMSAMGGKGGTEVNTTSNNTNQFSIGISNVLPEGTAGAINTSPTQSTTNTPSEASYQSTPIASWLFDDTTASQDEAQITGSSIPNTIWIFGGVSVAALLGITLLKLR